MELLGIMIGIGLVLFYFLIAMSLFLGLCWAIWQLRYFIVAIMIIYIFVAIFSKYSHAIESRSDICYTTMNVNHVDMFSHETLASQDDLNQSVNRVLTATNQDTFSKSFLARRQSVTG